ncbi:integration host factor subunit alpha [Acidithiobacillus sp. 'AMD consortium']|uniref:integration host factor subunit alpha n=1 Tax=Acidithiobacillus sp. 'AMD consortium' TaxID=2614801 RepID=UPI00124E5B03|nr:integration host factor subunit alpha [Acidithiobacillus sp. 'AMD consortium']QFG77842.1 integration host factor subunit alpha [Acidithiobacillus sp. 'AMD consortium']
MTVTKQDLTRHLLDTVGLTAKDCAAVANAVFDTLRATLAAGENVKLSGFGNFTLHEKRARPGRNPKTKEPVEISARRVVTFQASQLVKERCEEARILPPFGKARALAGD